MGIEHANSPQREVGFIQRRHCPLKQDAARSIKSACCDPEIVIDRDRLYRSLNALESFLGE